MKSTLKVAAEAKPQEVVFVPNKGPQTDFLSASEQEVLYGGAAGGGKSFAMVADPVRYFQHPQANMVLLRRTTEELRELKNVARQLYPRFHPGMRWSERDSTWTSPWGAKLWMSYLDRDDDTLRYQGQQYTWIGFDELTQWASPYAWDYMRSRLRTGAKDLPTYMRATSNPGGPGHVWVKKMFIDPAPWNKPFWARDIETGDILRWPKNSRYAQENNCVGRPMFTRRFIPAKLWDNPYISEDGRYEANLLSLSENQRKQLLDGNWDIAEGAAFPEFDREIHVTEPFRIPDNWIRFRACDYGYSSYSAVLWFAENPSNKQLFVYRELYVKRVHAEDLAWLIYEAEKGERIRYGMLDSSLWHQRGDKTCLANQMMKAGEYYLKWKPSDRTKGSRVSNKNQIHQLLAVNEFTGEPQLQIFRTCINLINELPTIPLDKNKPEDVDTKVDDHLYDALRYGVASRSQKVSRVLNKGSYNPVDPVFGY